jgi:MYXO-CTERM domain-containing protein
MERVMDMHGARRIVFAVTSLALWGAAPVHAHFKVLKPASWLNEDQLGGPQKGSPCGPGNSKLFIGDDVQPVPVSNAATTFHAGETITVELEETIYHPGYFRISLAKTRAAEATTTNFPDPALTDLQDCHYDRSAVKTVPHDNVLADGLFMAEGDEGTNRSLMQAVKLPSEPCEHCTLQIVQVMEGHPGASCFYFHCADVTILPAVDGGVDGGTADGGTAGITPASAGDGGCSVASAARRSSHAAWWLLALGAVLYRLRVRTPGALRRRAQSVSARLSKHM